MRILKRLNLNIDYFKLKANNSFSVVTMFQKLNKVNQNVDGYLTNKIINVQVLTLKREVSREINILFKLLTLMVQWKKMYILY